MKVSVITVTFNALPALQRTAMSVTEQDSTDYEYIVVDGASRDGTLDFLEGKDSRLIRWISEPDGGIYEAMNKGVRLAKGDYCIFMNAGDCFINRKVLRRVDKYLDGTDMVLGSQLLVSERGSIVGYYPSFNGFTLNNLLQSSVCHQSCFIRREVLLAHPYDESLRLVSDWKFFLERFMDGQTSFKTIGEDICSFRTGGATDKNVALGADERLRVLAAYPKYREIWESPYNPSFLLKVYRKILEQIKKIQYARVVNQ